NYPAINFNYLQQFVGAGVYYGAARTDAIGTRGCSIYLIGGGNSAGQAAMFFSNYATCVTLLVRGPSLDESMSRYLIDQLATRANIVVRTRAELVGVSGHTHMEEIEIRDNGQDRIERRAADAVFIFIGADAGTAWLPRSIALDDRGYVLTGHDIAEEDRDASLGRDPFLLETSVPGIFAAGDVRHGSMKRVASAVGEGSMAIAFIHQYLAALHGGEHVVAAVR
ncbi:MAG: NAD(P)/FAD-dependent oxidoreductase, partial [Chloroflexota bacterium]